MLVRSLFPVHYVFDEECRQLQVFCSPHTEDVEKHIVQSFDINRKTLHLVPTFILFRRRLQFYRGLLKDKGIPEPKPSKPLKKVVDWLRQHVGLYEFDEFLTTLAYSSSKKPMSKSESAILIERIMARHQTTNNNAWRSMSPRLATLFTNLSLTGLGLDELRTMDDSIGWKTTLDIFEEYLSVADSEGLLDLGQAMWHALNNFDLDEYDELILDGGFLPIMPRHHRLLTRFDSSGKPVRLYIPYDMSLRGNSSVRALEKVYSLYVPIDRWVSIEQEHSTQFFVSKLPKLFLEDNTTHYLDNSVTINKYSTMDSELSNIAKTIKVLTTRKGVSLSKIVIIAPQPMVLRPVIREICEQVGVETEIPERPVTSRLQGLAVKYLYETKVSRKRTDNLGTYLDFDMVHTFLQSGIFGTTSINVDYLSNIRAFVTDCTSLEEWKKIIKDLKNVREILDVNEFCRHPLSSVPHSFFDELEHMLNIIEDLVSRLFVDSIVPIKCHAESLLNILTSDSRITISPDILSKLESIRDSLDAQDRLPISAVEFGSRLNSLFVEPAPEDDNHFDFADVNTAPKTSTDNRPKIMVTGANNTEFQKYEYVFLCGFTQDMYPKPIVQDWPLTLEIQAQILSKTTLFAVSPSQLKQFYLDRELYHIRLAFMAADKQLYISYHSSRDGVDLTPAHYLHDIARVFGIAADADARDATADLETKLLEAGVLRCPELKSRDRHLDLYNSGDTVEHTPQATSFRLEDLATLKLCPRKFYYESSFRERNVFSDPFQLRLYAAACLYQYAIREFIQTFKGPITIHVDDKRPITDLLKKVDTSINKAEISVRPLFPVSLRQWQEIRFRAITNLTGFISRIVENNMVNDWKKKGVSSFKLDVRYAQQPQITVDVHGYSFTAERDIEVVYNGSIVHRYTSKSLKSLLSFFTSNPDKRSELDEVKNWYYDTGRKFFNESQMPALVRELKNLSDMINSGVFPKRPGVHCQYCSFRNSCLEGEIFE
jgi:ATP-dependent helicase/nuclease subunit B